MLASYGYILYINKIIFLYHHIKSSVAGSYLHDKIIEVNYFYMEIPGFGIQRASLKQVDT